jgi:aminomuconate-semialdehyde/2-hydroxymuconate-6-semialdehyde dehydrogenase
MAAGSPRSDVKTLTNFIGGEELPPAGGEYLDVLDPAVGRPVARAPESTQADVDAAVDAATGAFPGWASLPAAERSACLLRIADLIDARSEELARAESIDTGKPLSLARSLDIPRASANFRIFHLITPTSFRLRVLS